MSRIHEALKKAEEQRAAAQGGQNSGENPSAAGPGPVLSDSPSFARSVTFDMLLAKCPQGGWSPDAKTMLFFNTEEHVAGTEEFRTLRSRLYQMREQKTLKKVLITSALPKEGKSFVSANLAQALAQQPGRRVLLVDADLRAPRLHQVLGTSPAPGLTEYLKGESEELDIVQRGAMESLFFIPSGHSMASAAELVANGRMKVLLDRLAPLFDWVIIDSPPAVPVSDASLLANCCDGVLLVVRSNETPFDIAQRARQEFRDELLLGVVLNAIDRSSTAYNPYYYSAYPSANGKNGGKT